ncbi:MAG: acyl-CoA dehydrogenase family protein, partial [Candidatus Eisenbacteria bacterium]|nr:acyl-CoA dehydrogenase family protein [Candidatus Eisenbacteria bacterium]
MLVEAGARGRRDRSHEDQRQRGEGEAFLHHLLLGAWDGGCDSDEPNLQHPFQARKPKAGPRPRAGGPAVALRPRLCENSPSTRHNPGKEDRVDEANTLEVSPHWRAVAKDVAERVVRPLAAKYDRLQEYPWEIRDELAKAGLMGVFVPKQYGGAGGSLVDLCVCVEELSRACGGVGVLYAVNALGTFPVLVAGTEEQKQKYLPKIAAGEKLVAFCLSEKTAGSDAGSLKLEAKKDGEHYILNGEKKWTTNGGAAHIYSVFAVTDPESKSRRISTFVVDKDAQPGMSFPKVEDKMGIRCVPVVETHFTDVRVHQSQLLGGSAGMGFKHAMMTLDRARPGVASQAVGLAQGALDWAVAYASQRHQFGQSILSFQMIQKMLADMAARTEAARQLVYFAARAVEAGHPMASKYAAECKMFATDTAMEVTTNAVQIFGGYGYMKDYPIEKYMRDAKITQIYEGANQVQALVIARALTREVNQLRHLLEM